MAHVQLATLCLNNITDVSQRAFTVLFGHFKVLQHVTFLSR